MSLIERILILNQGMSMQYVRRIHGSDFSGFVLDANEGKIFIPKTCIIEKYTVIPRISGRILNRQTGKLVCYVKNVSKT